MKYTSYMVKIILDKKSVEVGKNPLDAFEELGINFDCKGGTCGLCRVKVLKGMENINPKTEAEENFPLEDNERLSCQCYKITGEIKIKNVEW